MFPKSVMKRIAFLLLALSLFLTPAPAAHAAAIHYARSNGVTTGTCSTWATACTLTYALTQAVAGDQLGSLRVSIGLRIPSTSIRSSRWSAAFQRAARQLCPIAIRPCIPPS